MDDDEPTSRYRSRIYEWFRARYELAPVFATGFCAQVSALQLWLLGADCFALSAAGLVRLARMAAVLPPRGLPTKSEFFRFRTMRFISRSLTLLSIGIAPSEQKTFTSLRTFSFFLIWFAY
jgi:hypothetical protein